jgi:hypothetical protein
MVGDTHRRIVLLMSERYDTRNYCWHLHRIGSRLHRPSHPQIIHPKGWMQLRKERLSV